jgi:HK97 family phage major capsid protein
MRTALETFRTVLDGEVLSFTAGRSRVEDDHPVLREHGDKFGDAETWKARERDTVAHIRAAARSGGAVRGTDSHDRRAVVGGPLGRADDGGPDQARELALRTIERHSELSARAADNLDQVVRRDDPLALEARYLAAVGTEAYRSAFGKLLADPTQGHLRFTPAEVEAVRITSKIESTRAMAEGTGSTGGFALPIEIDPTINLTSSGALNPIREVANVRTMSTRELRLVSSAGVTAEYTPEAQEAADASPTLAQPTIIAAKGDAFVPFTFELGDDVSALQGELQRLISDARDVLDATMFLTGTGTDQPAGVLTGLAVGQRVQTTTVATYAVGDPWLLKAQIPARFLANATFCAAPTTWDTTYRFVGGNSTEPLQLPTRDGPFLGKPKVEWSTMATGSTTGTKLIIGGDFRASFTIADRLGMTASVLPHLVGTNRRPNGQRGLYVYWRTGSKVVVPEALRYLEVK